MSKRSPRTSDSGVEFRYERKFHARDLTVDQMVMIVKSHPAHFIEPYPMRRISNIYFDTADLSDYRAHVLGASRRRKVRIRWYGSTLGSGKRAVLEVKAKDGDVGTKRHFGISALDFDGTIDLEAVRAAVAAGTAGEGMSGFFACAHPVLFNSYVRRYFVSVDRRYRITIDTGLEFRAVNDRAYSYVDSHDEGQLRILELKYGVQDGADAHRIVDRLPLRLSKYSKYVYGVERLRVCSN